MPFPFPRPRRRTPGRRAPSALYLRRYRQTSHTKRNDRTLELARFYFNAYHQHRRSL